MSAATTKEQLASKIMVALDFATAEQSVRLVEQLSGIPCWLKVGMQLFYSAGPDYIRKLKAEGCRVFLDLKMHDIPNTVQGGAASLTRLGVDMFNVHAAGGLKMMQAAMEGVADASNSSNGRPIVIGVTQLTSTGQAMLNEEIGIPGSVEKSVIHYAELTKKAGLHGVVASPMEVGSIKEACGSSFITVTPGIRPLGVDINDQTRVMTPREALLEGTDYMVIGRAINAATDPRGAIEKIIEEMSGR